MSADYRDVLLGLCVIYIELILVKLKHSKADPVEDHSNTASTTLLSTSCNGMLCLTFFKAVKLCDYMFDSTVKQEITCCIDTAFGCKDFS
jgi:hypothetical protein